VGMDDFVAKPIEISKLCKVLDGLRVDASAQGADQARGSLADRS
jgi:hypothetical protein